MEKKEAMKILKDFHDKSTLLSVRTALDTIIPELKESEREKIRKEIIEYIKTGTYHKNWVAWLENQGEHHIACSEEQMKVLNEVLNFAANHESPYWNEYIFETLSNLIRQLKN